MLRMRISARLECGIRGREYDTARAAVGMSAGLQRCCTGMSTRDSIDVIENKEMF